MFLIECRSKKYSRLVFGEDTHGSLRRASYFLTRGVVGLHTMRINNEGRSSFFRKPLTYTLTMS